VYKRQIYIFFAEVNTSAFLFSRGFAFQHKNPRKGLKL